MTARTAAVLSVCAVAAAVAGGTARAGFTPAWSYLPAPFARSSRRERRQPLPPGQDAQLLSLPRGCGGAGRKLTVTFTNRVRIRQGLWRWTSQTLRWQVQPLGAGKACTAWAPLDKTLQVDGNKVFSSSAIDGGKAWRCVVDKRGRTMVLSASAGGRLGDVGSAIVVASGLDVSGRTSGTTVALAVTPTSVRAAAPCSFEASPAAAQQVTR